MENEKNKQIIKVKDTTAFTGTELREVRDFTQMSGFIGHLIKSKTLPSYVDSPEMAFTMMNYGAELGFKPLESLHFITPVNGTLAANGKGANHILAKAKILFNTVYTAAYIYSDGIKEIISPRVLDLDEILGQLSITIQDFKDKTKYSENSQNRIKKFRDRVTTIEYGSLNNKKFEKLGSHSYFLSDAIESELDVKETYKKYLRDMMMYRCKVQIGKILGVITGATAEEIAMELKMNIIYTDGVPEIQEKP
jgi:hypothetical protein